MSEVEAVVQMVQKEESPSEFDTKALSEPIRSIVGVGGADGTATEQFPSRVYFPRSFPDTSGEIRLKQSTPYMPVEQKGTAS